MPMKLHCPVCRTEVTLLRDGYVTAHRNADGEPCPFKRTARSGPAYRQKRSAPERESLVAAREEKAATKNAAQARATSKKTQSKKLACLACGALVKGSAASPTGIAAHTRASGRWCRGGGAPTQAQRNQAAKGTSVRTVSGGLPTLGRRH